MRVVAAGRQWQIDDPMRKTVFDQAQRYRVERGDESLDIYDANAESRERKRKVHDR
jgi:hypothetical protein